MVVLYALGVAVCVLVIVLWVQGIQARRKGQRVRHAGDIGADVRQERLWQVARGSLTGLRTMDGAFYPGRDRTLRHKSEAQRVLQHRPDRIPNHVDDDR